MIEYFEALDALDRHGTTGAAGTALRISQSAVSKRLASLEARLGYAVMERRGRRIEFTPAGRELLNRVRPLLGELRDIVQQHDEQHTTISLTLGMSESILSSWGAAVLRQARDSVLSVHLETHTHRSPVVVDRVRSGEYLLGLCAGVADTAGDLAVQTVGREPMVIVPSGLQNILLRKGTRIITIEEHAATWSSIQRSVRDAGFEVAARVESFSAITRMAIAGLGHGLVPVGTAQAAGLCPDQYQISSRVRITRPVSIIGRRSGIARAPTSVFVEQLADLSQAALSSLR
jgi:DNA-binding transcriptional LysR family regulator